MTFLALLAILATFFVTCECYFSASLLKSAKARAPHLDLFGGGKRSGSGSKKVIDHFPYFVLSVLHLDVSQK